MKRVIVLLLGFLAASAILGCAAVKKDVIYSKASASKGRIFEEDRGEGKPGDARLAISISFKTHTEGFYLLESKSIHHGTPEYPVVFNIDGQGVIWPAEGKLENTPGWDDKGKRISDGGEGMRYSLAKRLRLTPGVHVVYFGFPDDGVSKEVEIRLSPGETARLDLKPVYKNHNRQGGECFQHGLRSFEARIEQMK